MGCFIYYLVAQNNMRLLFSRVIWVRNYKGRDKDSYYLLLNGWGLPNGWIQELSEYSFTHSSTICVPPPPLAFSQHSGWVLW